MMRIDPRIVTCCLLIGFLRSGPTGGMVQAAVVSSQEAPTVVSSQEAPTMVSSQEAPTVAFIREFPHAVPDDQPPLETAIQAFDQGTIYLHDGRFTDAIEQFRRSEETGLGSGALYYNLGYAYYRLNQTGESVRYFTRAARLLPDNPRIEHSLEIISNRMKDSFSTLPAPIWKTAQRWLLLSVSTSTYFIVGLLLYVITVVMIGLSITGLGPISWYERLRGISGGIAFILILIAITATIWPPWPAEAVILTDEVAIHDQPDSESPTAVSVHEGLIVSTLSTADGWTLVQLPNGARGWLEANVLGAI